MPNKPYVRAVVTNGTIHPHSKNTCYLTGEMTDADAISFAQCIVYDLPDKYLRIMRDSINKLLDREGYQGDGSED